jgi:hypothetical protein
MKKTILLAIVGSLFAVVLARSSGRENAPKAGAFEYCERGITINEDSTGGAYKTLNIFGKEGWEVISFQFSGNGSDSYLLFVMKRPLDAGGKTCAAINEDLNKRAKTSR